MAYIPPAPFAWNYCPICGGALARQHDGESERPFCAGCHRYFYRNPVPATCCFVRGENNSLLFAQRGVEPCKGHWTLPGGFLELGETAEEGAARELREETGLTAARLMLVGVSTKQSLTSGAILLLGFLAADWAGEVRPAGDVHELRFFSKDTRPAMCFPVHQEILDIYDRAAAAI